MRVLAARFADREAAARVLEQLRAALRLGPRDAETAPLGEADDPDGLTLLAGRFQEARVPEVRKTIEQAGGEVVADVDEGLTMPRGGPRGGSGSQGRFDGRRGQDANRSGNQPQQAVAHQRF